MRLGRNHRALSSAEKALATSVFGPTLPPWERIMLDDGLGLNDACYTLSGPGNNVMIHIGPIAFPDCTSLQKIPTQGPVDQVFIHEMTHVWQLGLGKMMEFNSLWAQTTRSDASAYTVGDAWDDYDAEQQASLVEHWYASGKNESIPEFAYIKHVVRKHGRNASLSLTELRSMA